MLRTANCKGVVVLNSEDTDLHVQATYVPSHQLNEVLRNKHKNEYFRFPTMVLEDAAHTIMPIPVITGSGYIRLL